MIIDVKTKFYNIIKDLGYTIYDNPYTIDGQRRHLPYCQIRTNNIKRAMFQQNFINAVEFKVDMWSKYSGEKEILEMEKKIAGSLEKLYELDPVVFVIEKSFKILDDKSTGAVMKHAIAVYDIALEGKETNDGNTNN